MTETPSFVVRYGVEEGVGRITLARPKVNAYEIGLMQQLRRSVDVAHRDPRAAVVVLCSAFPNIFSVGADIKAWARNDVATNQHLVDTAREVARAMAASDKVFIAALEGHALGGGLELAMACDLRFAAQGDYLLGLPEVKLGLLPGNGGTQRLLRLVGPARALELIATGESVGPEQALADGLVDRLVPAKDLLPETDAFARALARGPAQALSAIKTAIREGTDTTLAAGLALEERLSDGLYETPDAIEGLQAYLEKRPPRFGDKDSS